MKISVLYQITSRGELIAHASFHDLNVFQGVTLHVGNRSHELSATGKILDGIQVMRDLGVSASVSKGEFVCLR